MLDQIVEKLKRDVECIEQSVGLHAAVLGELKTKLDTTAEKPVHVCGYTLEKEREAKSVATAALNSHAINKHETKLQSANPDLRVNHSPRFHKPSSDHVHLGLQALQLFGIGLLVWLSGKRG